MEPGTADAPGPVSGTELRLCTRGRAPSGPSARLGMRPQDGFVKNMLAEASHGYLAKLPVAPWAPEGALQEFTIAILCRYLPNLVHAPA